MDILDQVAQVVPVKYQTAIIASGLVLKWLSELYSSVKSGGGLKRIIMSFWFGEQTAKVITDDYKAELKTTPIIPPPAPPAL